MLFTVWSNPDGTQLCLSPGTGPAMVNPTTPDPECTVFCYSFEAGSHNAAMAEFHRRQGWKPYVPMVDEEGRPYPSDSEPWPE